MNRIFRLLLLAAIVTGFWGCKPAEPVEFIFLQINDVYEITPLESGAVGGMARVASLRNQLLEENSNTITILSGDFLNPSGMGQVRVDGEKLYGKQMVDVMNKTGVDYVTFGNHEFDLKEADLLKRIGESNFGWISGNVSHVMESGTKPFQWKGEDIPAYKIIEIQPAEGDPVKVGILSVTLNENQPSYTQIDNFMEKAKAAYEEMKDKCDVPIAMTHLTYEDDQELAKEIPGIKLVMGGHEHTYHYTTVGETQVCKADANAKSAWIHRFTFDPATGNVTIKSDTVQLRGKIQEDATVKAAVDEWVDKVNEGLEKDGYHPDSVIATVLDPLDGLESSNRTHQTNLGQLVAGSMAYAWEADGAEIALLNAGSIRIDDYVVGEITEYDIIRILPFGGSSVKVNMPGDMLIEMLNIGSADSLMGNGAFIQYYGVQGSGGMWATLDGKEIDPAKSYTIAGGDYLIQNEAPYEALRQKYEGKYTVTAGTEPNQIDVRKGLIAYFQKNDE